MTVHFDSNDHPVWLENIWFWIDRPLLDDRSLNINFKEEWYKKGGYKRNVKCECKNGQNGDPAWKKSCSWSFNGASWSPSDVDTVQCKPATFQPPNSWPIGTENMKFDGVTVYPHYEVSIDLNLAENPHKSWSNLLAFHQNGVKGFDSSVHVPGNIPLGARIPAVFVHGGSTKLHICTTRNDSGNQCWNTPNEMPVGEWFNLKIKESFRRPYLTSVWPRSA